MMSSSQVTQTATVKTEDSLSLLKLSKYLAATIIFFGATQFGLHFWPSSALVYGIRIDYLSPTLYFLDLLIILYLVLSRQFRSFGDLLRSKRQIGTSVAPLLLTNLLYSQNPLATLSWSLHLLLYLAFFVVLLPQFRSFGDLQRSARQIGTSAITLPLTLSLLFQAALAASQAYLGRSVGGFMYYLGERMVSVGSPGVALGSFMNQVVLRAYGTFSHPNILAGYAVISLLIILRLSPAAKGSDPLRRSWPVAKMFSRLQNTSWRPGQILLVPLIPVLLILFLTQSRAVALSLFGIIIPFFLIKKLKYRIIYFVLILSMTLSLPSLVIPARNDLSSSNRLTLQNLSFGVIQTFPIFGTGAQSSVASYPQVNSSARLLQPDHNSFTLFLSWFGIFGLLPLFSEFRSLRDFRRVIGTFVIPLFPILPLLLFDHYLLTSPQGLFIIILYLSTSSPVLNYIYAQKNRQ